MTLETTLQTNLEQGKIRTESDPRKTDTDKGQEQQGLNQRNTFSSLVQ